MLILSRRPGEKIIINDDIYIKVNEIKGNQVRFAIEAPESVSVHREEIYNLIKRKEDIKNGKSLC